MSLRVLFNVKRRVFERVLLWLERCTQARRREGGGGGGGKIPVISPGLIQLCKGFWVGL